MEHSGAVQPLALSNSFFQECSDHGSRKLGSLGKAVTDDVVGMTTPSASLSALQDRRACPQTFPEMENEWVFLRGLETRFVSYS